MHPHVFYNRLLQFDDFILCRQQLLLVGQTRIEIFDVFVGADDGGGAGDVAFGDFLDFGKALLGFLDILPFYIIHVF